MRVLLTLALLACSLTAQTSVAALESKQRTGSDGLLYIWMPPGTSILGCSPGDSECFAWEQPSHTVTFTKGFWIGQTEVTQDAYQRMTGSNPSRYRGPDLPVEQVSCYDAASYCAKIGLRLPTAAEWEYAARAGTPAARYGDLDAIAWSDATASDKTHPVAQKKPNPFGLYDTLGNVWEWVEDDYLRSGRKQKILYGGSIFNPGAEVRASNYVWATPETAHRNMGIRCASD